MTDLPPEDELKPLFTQHSRIWRDHLYVYPVISRRSEGVSIGVNLNPDKACNFDCIYCQVDRRLPPTVCEVDIKLLSTELECTIQAALSGELFEDPKFRAVPDQYRRIKDIAFSGDGEPTIAHSFPAAVRAVVEIRRRFKLSDTKLVLITNAAYLDKPAIQEALTLMDDNNGEIWAKLDAGSEDYYRLINRPNVPLKTILANILDAASRRPIVIQSLWMNVHGKPPPDSEIEAFAQNLHGILKAGGQIRLVQVYTTARQTAQAFVTPLTEEALKIIAQRIKTAVDLPIKTYSP